MPEDALARQGLGTHRRADAGVDVMQNSQHLTVRTGRALTGGGVALIAALVVGLLWAMTFSTFEIWGGLLVATVLVVVSAPLLHRVVAAEPDRRIGRIIVVAFLIKLTGALIFYFVVSDLYGTLADADMYAEWGRHISTQLRGGDFAVDVGGGLVGTSFIRLVTGVVFTLVGPTTLGGFFVFSWLAFWGLYGFYRAFRMACPEADHRRYALIVFLLPSLLFWTSSIGKDAWMMAALGLTAYGAAKTFSRQPRGYPLLIVGLSATAVVRPHMFLIATAAVSAGYLRRVRPNRTPLLGPTAQVVGTTLVVIATFVAVQHVVQHWDLEEESAVASLGQLLDRTERNTARGGSTFETGFAQRPSDVPVALVGVLFRPFPFEAVNRQQLLTSFEGVVLLLLMALSWRRLWEGARQVFANPYLRAAAVYSILFILAFAAIGNFGILARQRTQLFPLLFVFLALRPRVFSSSSNLLPGLGARWKN